MEQKINVLRCKSSTDSSKLAGSIYSIYKTEPDSRIIIRVIGAGSLNQAAKAVIISNRYFAKKGLVVGMQPSFKDTEEGVTAMELKIILTQN